jgi:hypothetical protein
MRYVVLVLAGLVLIPVGVVGGLVMLTAFIGEFLNFQLFDFSDISLLDWLAGGPGASSTSFENYISGFVGFVVAFAGFGGIKLVWDWTVKAPMPSPDSER